MLKYLCTVLKWKKYIKNHTYPKLLNGNQSNTVSMFLVPLAAEGTEESWEWKCTGQCVREYCSKQTHWRGTGPHTKLINLVQSGLYAPSDDLLF